jgi:integrase
MGRRRKGAPPPYCLHKASGLAYCRVGGHVHYLGKFGTPESRKRYHELTGHEPGPPAPLELCTGCRVSALAAEFLRWAASKYRTEDGTPTSTLGAYTAQLGTLVRTFGARAADSLRAPDLRRLQEHWQGEGLSAASVNSAVGHVRKLYRWALGRGLVSPETVVSLAALSGLEPGVDAPGPREVGAARWEDLQAALPLLSRQLQAMVRLEWAVGCRPGEVCRVRGAEVYREGVATVRAHGRAHALRVPPPCWCWVPRRHKGSHRGRVLAYVLGPAARGILADWLRADPEEFLFQPRENPRARGRPGDHYGPGAYYQALTRACRRAGVGRVHPNMIRHSFAQRAEAAVGLVDTSKLLGHATTDTTLIYLERDLARAAELAERFV